MLKLIISGEEFYNETTNEFIYSKEITISLEHSLVSIKKWESTWKKSFLNSLEYTDEEMLDYIHCMVITQNVTKDTLARLTTKQVSDIAEYIKDSHTATTIDDNSESSSANTSAVITAELIYYWMIAYNIPAEYQKWHLQNLLMLIRVCQEKNAPEKKTKRQQSLSEMAILNAKRKQQLKTKG